MATIGDVIVPQAPSETATARRRWPLVAAAFLIGFVLAVVLALGGLAAWDRTYDGRVLPGVHVGAVDLSGMDRASAAGALMAAYPLADGRLVVHLPGHDITIPYVALGRRLETDEALDAAMAAGREGTVIERAIAEVRHAVTGLRITPRVVLDQAAVQTRVAKAVDARDRPAVEGRIALDGDGIRRTMASAGVDFDGAGVAAAAAAALQRLDAPAEVSVAATSTAIEPKHTDLETAVAAAAMDRMARGISVTLDDDRWKLKAGTVRGWLRFGTNEDGAPWPLADPAAIAASLDKVEAGVGRKAVSAKYLRTRGGRIVGVVAAKDGRALDRDETAIRIAQELQDRATGAVPVAVTAATTTLAPKLSTAEALKHGPQMVRLGTWKTWFPVSERNYFGANIWRPAAIIDGTVLMPGRRFEWWSRLGPVTAARGFGPGGFIAGDHTEPTGALGGGMCSSSTTLFNAALRAGLQMGARSNHRYYIDRYPLGLDATVSKTRGGGGQTMSFTNDMDDPIVIRAFRYRSGGRGWVRYEIWGIPDGRKVTLSRPTVSNVRKAVTRTEYVTTLPKGRREQVEYPANGMDVAVTRTVRNAAGKVIHRETYRTHYALWDGLIQIGR